MIARRQFLGSICATALGLAVVPGLYGASGSRWPLPPQVARKKQVVGNFGYQRVDHYAWLKPEDWQAVLRDPESLDDSIKSALIAENEYLEAMMAPSRALQRKLIARSQAVEQAATKTLIAVENGGYLYYDVEGQDGEKSYRRRNPDGEEQLLLDVAAEARGKAYYSLSFQGPQHSPDHKLFAWAADETGADIFRVRVRDIASGKLLVDDINDAHGSLAFDAGGRYLFWVSRSDKGRPDGVWRRDMHSGADTRIYQEADPAFYIGLRTTASGAYVAIDIVNAEQTEVRLVAAANPTAAPVLVEPRTAGLRYHVDHWNEQLVILTDADGAEDYKIMTTPPRKPERKHWRELVPHQPGRLISGLTCFATHLVREEWRDAKPRLVIMAADGSERDTAFPEPAYALSVPGGQGYDNRSLVYVYQSPRTPPSLQTLPLDMSRGSGEVATAATGAAYRPDDYIVERLQAVADDGETIPITVLRAKSAPPAKGGQPLFLYAYGSYGASVEAEFSAAAVALVDQGWSYAIAHVRGGAEKGSNWWRSVLGQGKKTTFTDFISCAEHLIDQGYTARQRIVAHGYSAGGLLMGAVYTMRPDLWAGVIAQVPFVDILNTIDDYENHPLGTTSFPIWGDPRVPANYEYMASYSPYDNLEAAPYPPLLATGGVADSRVAFWEPVKFAAKARALTTTLNPIMVQSALAGGHGGASGAQAQREQQALFQAFAIWAEGRLWGDVAQRPDQL